LIGEIILPANTGDGKEVGFSFGLGFVVAEVEREFLSIALLYKETLLEYFTFSTFLI
jgi:hypothetical protein